jgi:two-component system, NarL family, response regulator YdfI
MVRVLIKALSPMSKAGLETLVGADPSLHVIQTASAEDSEADVVVAELESRDDEIAAEVLDDAAAGVAVILLVRGSTAEWADTLREGVKAVLPRNVTGLQIAAAIQAAAAGLVVLHTQEVESLLRLNESPEQLAEPLTPREIDILRVLAEGLGNKEIAARLGISEHTVKFHVASVMGKLAARSRTEAVTLGIRRGLVLV